MADEGNDDVLPFVVTCDVGSLEDGVAIRLTYATSEERHEARQWDTAVYGMSRDVANSLATALLRETGGKPRQTTRATRH